MYRWLAMGKEQELEQLEQTLRDVRTNLAKVRENFEAPRDVQSTLVRNLLTQERYLLELIKEKREKLQ